MEFKPINALRYCPAARRFSENKFVVDTSTSTAAAADDDQNITINGNSAADDGDLHSIGIGEDNERLDMNLNGRIAGRLTQTLHDDAEKILKRPKLSEVEEEELEEDSPTSATRPLRPLVKSSSSTNLPEQKSSFFGIRGLSLTPSPSLFRKSYSWRHSRRSGSNSSNGSSFVQEKLVLPTIVITSTPIKDSKSSLNDDTDRVPSHFVPSPLSKENMQIFESECEMQDVSRRPADDGKGEDMEFSFICEPAESECGGGGDPFNDTMETSACDLFQPPLEPVFNIETSLSMNTLTSDAALLKRCQSAATGSRAADVTAFAGGGGVTKEQEFQVGTSLSIERKEEEADQHSNKENEFLAPDKKCLGSKRVKSATVRVLHALTVSARLYVRYCNR